MLGLSLSLDCIVTLTIGKGWSNVSLIPLVDHFVPITGFRIHVHVGPELLVSPRNSSDQTDFPNVSLDKKVSGMSVHETCTSYGLIQRSKFFALTYH